MTSLSNGVQTSGLRSNFQHKIIEVNFSCYFKWKVQLAQTFNESDNESYQRTKVKKKVFI